MKSFKALFIKDMRCFFRARATVVATFGFALLLIVVASFAYRHVGYGQNELKAVTPGILWTVFLFSGVSLLNQSFASEKENLALTGLLLTAVDPALIYSSKLLTNFLFLVFLQMFVTIFHGVLFGVEIFPNLFQLFLTTVLMALNFSSLGTLLASIAVATTGKEMVLPLLLFPLSLPGISGAVYLTREILKTGALSYNNFWFILLLTSVIISVSLGLVLFEFTVRD